MGKSLAANVELVLNNARLAGASAMHFQQLGGYDAAVTAGDVQRYSAALAAAFSGKPGC